MKRKKGKEIKDIKFKELIKKNKRQGIENDFFELLKRAVKK